MTLIAYTGCNTVAPLPRRRGARSFHPDLTVRCVADVVYNGAIGREYRVVLRDLCGGAV